MIAFFVTCFTLCFFVRQLFIYRLLLTVFVERFRRSVSVIIYTLVSLILLTVELLSSSYLQMQTFILSELVIYLTGLILFRSDIIRLFLTVFLSLELLKISDFFFQSMLSSFIPGVGEQVYEVSWERGAMFISYTAILFICQKKALHIAEKHLFKTGIFHIPGLVLLILIAMTGDLYAKLYLDLMNEEFFRLWFFVILLAALFTVLSAVLVQTRRKKAADDLREARFNDLVQSYRKLQRDYQERREFLHDTKKHYLLIKKYADSAEYDKISPLIEKVLPDSSTQGLRTFSEHEILDMMVSIKTEEAEKAGICCRVFSDNLSGIRLSDDEICVLLGNLFDNAVEAQEGLSKDEAWIELSMKKQEGLLSIIMKNPCREEPVMKNGRPVSEKKGFHGVGLDIVEKIVSEYNGAALYSWDNGIFTANLYFNGFQLPDQKSVVFSE